MFINTTFKDSKKVKRIRFSGGGLFVLPSVGSPEKAILNRVKNEGKFGDDQLKKRKNLKKERWNLRFF